MNEYKNITKLEAGHVQLKVIKTELKNLIQGRVTLANTIFSEQTCIFESNALQYIMFLNYTLDTVDRIKTYFTRRPVKT